MLAAVPYTHARDTLRGRVLVVANPAAACVTDGLVDSVLARLRAAGAAVEARGTAGPGLGGAAHDDRPDAVVAIGGDGTVRAVAQAVAALPGPRPVLVALPAGSGNSTSRNLWGDLALPEVIERALDPAACVVRRIDLLHLTEPGVLSVLGASSGFLAAVLVGARGVPVQVRGRDRYFAAAAQVLQAMPAHPTRVTVDGVVVFDGPASSVTVGGGRFRAHGFQFLPQSLLDDGLLDVSVIAALDGAALAELVPLIPTGEHLARPEVGYARGRRVEIARTDGAPLVAEYDGEVWTDAGPRLTAEVVPGALPVLAPRRPPAG